MFPQKDIVVYGHNHTGGLVSSNKTKFINLESSGCTNNDITTYKVLSFKQDGFSCVEKKLKYNREKFLAVHEDTNYPNKSVTGRIFFGTRSL